MKRIVMVPVLLLVLTWKGAAARADELGSLEAVHGAGVSEAMAPVKAAAATAEEFRLVGMQQQKDGGTKPAAAALGGLRLRVAVGRPRFAAADQFGHDGAVAIATGSMPQAAAAALSSRVLQAHVLAVVQDAAQDAFPPRKQGLSSATCNLLQGGCPSSDVCASCISGLAGIDDVSEDEGTQLLLACLMVAGGDCSRCPWQRCEVVQDLVTELDDGRAPSEEDVNTALEVLLEYVQNDLPGLCSGELNPPGRERPGVDSEDVQSEETGECTGDGECEACVEFERIWQMTELNGNTTEAGSERVAQALLGCLATVPSTCGRCDWEACGQLLTLLNTLSQGGSPSSAAVNDAALQLLQRTQTLVMFGTCEGSEPQDESFCAAQGECSLCLDFLDRFEASQGGNGTDADMVEALVDCLATSEESCPLCGWESCELAANLSATLSAGGSPADEDVDAALLALLSRIQQELRAGCPAGDVPSNGSAPAAPDSCTVPGECDSCLAYLDSLGEGGTGADEDARRELLAACLLTTRESCPTCSWADCESVVQFVDRLASGADPPPTQEEFEEAVFALLVHATDDLVPSCPARNDSGATPPPQPQGGDSVQDCDWLQPLLARQLTFEEVEQIAALTGTARTYNLTLLPDSSWQSDEEFISVSLLASAKTTWARRGVYTVDCGSSTVVLDPRECASDGSFVSNPTSINGGTGVASNRESCEDDFRFGQGPVAYRIVPSDAGTILVDELATGESFEMTFE